MVFFESIYSHIQSPIVLANHNPELRCVIFTGVTPFLLL